MFAVIKSGGKQYKVEKNSKLLIEKISGNIGDEILLKDVIMTNDGKTSKYGSPSTGASMSMPA